MLYSFQLKSFVHCGGCGSQEDCLSSPGATKDLPYRKADEPEICRSPVPPCWHCVEVWKVEYQLRCHAHHLTEVTRSAANSPRVISKCDVNKQSVNLIFWDVKSATLHLNSISKYYL
ncbi:hypothetical protein TNCV_2415411 [Trichonephila clavipes]|nr:hypothetical protein TNCV_2415411 [Trichonephila clavipes]